LIKLAEESGRMMWLWQTLQYMILKLKNLKK
jgi:hypothetical protein